MIQCLNIVLLLHDPHRSFEVLFDTTIEHIESYSSTVDNTRIISLICQLINGLDMSHQTSKSLQHGKILLKCLESEPNNYHFIKPNEMYALDEFYVNQHFDRLVNDENWNELIEFTRRFISSHYELLRKKRRECTLPKIDDEVKSNKSFVV